MSLDSKHYQYSEEKHPDAYYVGDGKFYCPKCGLLDFATNREIALRNLGITPGGPATRPPEKPYWEDEAEMAKLRSSAKPPPPVAKKEPPKKKQEPESFDLSSFM